MKKLIIITLILAIAVFGVKKVANFVGTAAGKTVSAAKSLNTEANRQKLKSAAQEAKESFTAASSN